MGLPKILTILFLTSVTLATCQKKTVQKPGELKLEPTFSIADKNPLGLFVAHQLIQCLLPSLQQQYNSNDFYSFYKKNKYNDQDIFLVIAKQFLPSPQDVESMADYVSNGNTLFVAANRFDETFLDKFHLYTNKRTSPVQELLYNPTNMSKTSVKLSDTNRFNNIRYGYFYYPLIDQVYREESFPSQTIALNQNDESGGVVFNYGSGRIIVLANALSFTNYFLLSKNNYQYLVQLVSYLPAKSFGGNSLVWDNYYNRITKRRDNDFSAFKELLKEPAMKWAFWLLLFLGIVWVLNGMIRRQRIIPIITPNTNSSIAFAETIARLYLLKKDNKNIAAKMVVYFLEHIRSKHYIQGSVLNNEFAQLLSAKTGQPFEKAKTLLFTIHQIQQTEMVSDYMLLDLNEQLQPFL